MVIKIVFKKAKIYDHRSGEDIL